jgi:ubiquinone/menaquinone biosynthesis C-methylase UbiE
MAADNEPVRPLGGLHAFLYDLGARLSGERLAPLRELVAGEARGRVLEIGCGTGANLEYYRWAYVDSLEASDPDPYMLRRAQHWLRRLPPYVKEKLKLARTPAETLPYEDASFDVVISTLVLCSVKDLDKSIAEVKRVLKPGGQFRLLEHVAGTGWEYRCQRVLQPVYGVLASRCRLTRRTEETLRNAGFQVEIEQRTRFGPLFPAFVAVATKPS